MHINVNTKIAAIIKANPQAIDAIAGINPHFKKLQNPVLRKIFASRVTIGDAAKIGKCDVSIFFEKLKPLGFVADEESKTIPQKDEEPATDFIDKHDKVLDVREDISNGKDPFRKIMQAISELSTGEVLLLINSFEPLPLIAILKEKNFETNTVQISAAETHTYIKKKAEAELATATVNETEHLFFEMLDKYEGQLVEINVRSLPMPQPMTTILQNLETLPEHMALFVYHKKVPMFLLPELKERNCSYALRHTPEGVEMIIYKNHP